MKILLQNNEQTYQVTLKFVMVGVNGLNELIWNDPA